MTRASRNLPFLLKIYFIAGGIILVTGALLYNNTLIRKMQLASESEARLFSRFIALEMQAAIALRDSTDQNRLAFMRDLRAAATIPYIVTDTMERPMFWYGIDAPKIENYVRVQSYYPGATPDSLIEAVIAKARSFDRANDPMPIEIGDVRLGQLHYGTSALTRELAVAPYVQVGVFVLFMLFGLLGFRAMKIGEQRSIWVGMAKETAHQLGTPLSSLMGWIAIIREEAAAAACSERLEKAIEEIAVDIERLAKISERFSKIGSAPKLEYHELTPIIEETVRYFERRRPALRVNSTITIEIGELPVIRCSRELIGWVIENLLKNALDAIAGEEGKIHIEGRMSERERRIEVLVSDTGKGMSPRVRDRVFTPGYTTKSRGWGLGLALVKRIVEEIHGGTIRVLHTQPGKGTTFIITFPVD